MVRRGGLPRSRLRERRRKRTLMLGGLSLLAFCAAAGGFVFLMHFSAVRIAAITVEGAETLEADTLQAFAHDALAGAYAGVLPRDSIFFYPKGALSRALLVRYPSLKSVSIQRDTFQSITVAVSEREPRALWCGLSPEEYAPCLLLDDNGLAYAPAPHFSEPVYPSYYGLIEEKEELPRQYLDAGAFRSLAPLIDAIVEAANLGLPESISVDADRDTYLRFENGFELIFSLGDDAGAVLESFSLALSSGPLAAQPLAEVEYLDLRFGEKLYYKLR